MLNVCTEVAVEKPSVFHLQNSPHWPVGGSSKWKFPGVLETIILILEELEEDVAHIFLHLFPSIPFVVQPFCRRKAEAQACIYKVIGR